MLLASILKSVSNARQLFAAGDFIRRHFQVLFCRRFKGAIHNGANWQDDGAKKDTMGLGKKYEWG